MNKNLDQLTMTFGKSPTKRLKLETGRKAGEALADGCWSEDDGGMTDAFLSSQEAPSLGSPDSPMGSEAKKSWTHSELIVGSTTEVQTRSLKLHERKAVRLEDSAGVARRADWCYNFICRLKTVFTGS